MAVVVFMRKVTGEEQARFAEELSGDGSGVAMLGWELTSPSPEEREALVCLFGEEFVQRMGL